jgi:starvation-inducible DNA-binding protein
MMPSPDASQKLADHLNKLLASYQLYYQNLRGFHWNIKGPQFFELHAKFEEYYTEAATVIDEIAERILAIKHQPAHTLEDYLAHSVIKSAKGLVSAEDTVKMTLENSRQLASLLKEVLHVAEETGDEPTTDMMTALVGATEKRNWMLSSYFR